MPENEIFIDSGGSTYLSDEKQFHISTLNKNDKSAVADGEKITVAGAIIRCLELEGINTIFGYPGAAICPFYDELYKSSIEHILVRQESNGGHSANGFARITGKPAVCVATSGPGATNLITAIATAYMDSIPIVCITGQVNTEQIGRDVFQEADITGAAEPFVKHSFLVKEPNEICGIVKKAFYIAGTGRPGPVLIDIPFDVQLKEIEFSYPASVDIRSYKPTFSGNKLQIKRVAEAIANAKRPLICVGGGVFASNAQKEMCKLAERCEIPVINTMMGISAMPSNHHLYFGMLGMHGFQSANIAISKCDLLILLGARVGDRAIASIENLKNINVIHVDIDPAEIGKNLHATFPIVGDLKTVLTQILEIAEKRTNIEWISILNEKRINEQQKRHTEKKLSAKHGFVNPKAFIIKLNEHLPHESIVVADVGQNQIWTANHLQLCGGRFLTSGGMGTMGYSIPAAIGAKKASPTSFTLAVCGDGSFQMQFMELATMIQHNIDVKIIIMVNRRLGMVRELQTNRYDNHQIAVFLDGSPDFIKIGQAYGISGATLTNIDEADDMLKQLVDSKLPYILQVMVEEEEKTII